MRNKTVIALGMFDGIHLGHRKLISLAAEIALKNAALPMLYTFSNHPSAVLGGKNGMLMTAAEREEEMLELGIKKVVMREFTAEFASIEPMEFVRRISEEYDPYALVVGFNYRFGSKAKGDVELLRQLSAKYGYKVEEVPAVTLDGETVSSTCIKRLLTEGETEKANGMLFKPYRVSGRICSGRKIGREIGFPTANLSDYGEKLVPKSGVYISRITLDGMSYKSVTNIGRNPTVEGREVTIETHIPDFSGDIYEKHAEIAFLSYLREEKKFSDRRELSEQIARDIFAVKNAKY